MNGESEFNSSLKLIAKSSVIVFVFYTLAKVLSYVYRVAIARNYGAEYYGLFSLAMMVAGWITVFAIFGLNDGLLRYISMFRGKKEQDKINYIFRKAFYLLLFTGLVGGMLLFISSSYIANNVFHNSNLTIFLQLFSITIPLDVILVLFLAPLRAYEKVGWRIFISSVLISLLHVVFILLFIASGIGIIAIPLSYVIGMLGAVLAAFVILKKQAPEIFIKKAYKGADVFKDVLTYSWPLIFAEIIWKVFKWTDSFFIGYFKTAVDVGLYNAAIPIALLLTFSSDLFMQMFVPLINKEYSKNNTEVVKQLSQQVGKWIFFTNLPILILLFLFPGEFLNLLFGKEFVVGADALRVLTIGVMFLSISGVPTRVLGMLGKSKKVLFDILVTALINLVLNIMLIPKYGIYGAAASTSFSFIILSVIVTLQAYKEIKVMPIRRKNLNILAAAIVSLVLLLVVKSFIEINNVSLIILSVFFIAFYTLLVLLFRGFDKNDFMIFRSFLGKIKK